MSRNTRIPLRWRIALVYIGLLVLVVAGLSLYLADQSIRSTNNTVGEHLLAEARLVALSAGSLLRGGGSPAELQQLAEQSAALSRARVTIILPDGTVLAESDTDLTSMDNHANRPEIQKALAGEENIQVRFSDTLAAQTYYGAVPVEQDGRVIAVVRLALPNKAVEVQLDSIRTAYLVSAALVILLGSLAGGLLAAYATRPLRRLSDHVQRIVPQGDPSPAFAQKGDEIAELDQAFSRLESRLSAQTSQFQAEQTKLSTILEQMTDGILIVDQDGNLRHINPAALTIFHIPIAAPIGQSLASVVRQHQLVELWRKCQTSQKMQTTTVEISLEGLFIQAIASPLGESMPGSTLIVIQDLTRLRRLELMRRDFVSNVSHELRTPLASLKALAETLQEGALEDPPAARRFLQRMDHEIDNLTQMVRELLELSRIESGKVPLVKRTILPYELAAPAVERMQVQAERAGLHMQMNIPADLPVVNADPERVEQVLVNLLHNAIKFTPAGGQIEISAHQEVGMLVFCVRDTGVGIESDALPRIFERFYKADRSRSGGGTGLGLSIARHIIEAHNGRIWATSAVGEGSSFYFSLPLL